jgi:hypothetical protein
LLFAATPLPQKPCVLLMRLCLRWASPHRISDSFRQFLARYAIQERELEVERQFVEAIAGYQRRNSDEAAISWAETAPLPHVTKQDIIRIFRERWRDVAGRFIRAGWFRHLILI